MRSRGSWLWFWTLAGVLAAASPANAFQTIPMSVQQLASASDIIVHGKVVSKSCLKDTTGRIFTKIELAVSEIWKGTVTSNRFTIVHGGGVLGSGVRGSE
jgi:hypothetical protein